MAQGNMPKSLLYTPAQVIEWQKKWKDKGVFPFESSVERHAFFDTLPPIQKITGKIAKIKEGTQAAKCPICQRVVEPGQRVFTTPEGDFQWVCPICASTRRGVLPRGKHGYPAIEMKYARTRGADFIQEALDEEGKPVMVTYMKKIEGGGEEEVSYPKTETVKGYQWIEMFLNMWWEDEQELYEAYMDALGVGGDVYDDDLIALLSVYRPDLHQKWSKETTEALSEEMMTDTSTEQEYKAWTYEHNVPYYSPEEREAIRRRNEEIGSDAYWETQDKLYEGYASGKLTLIDPTKAKPKEEKPTTAKPSSGKPSDRPVIDAGRPGGRRR